MIDITQPPSIPQDIDISEECDEQDYLDRDDSKNPPQDLRCIKIYDKEYCEQQGRSIYSDDDLIGDARYLLKPNIWYIDVFDTYHHPRSKSNQGFGKFLLHYILHKMYMENPLPVMISAATFTNNNGEVIEWGDWLKKRGFQNIPSELPNKTSRSYLFDLGNNTTIS